jgi:hypothetical protein
MMALTEQLLDLGREIAAEQDRALAQDLSLGSVRARVVGRPLQRPRRVRWGAAAFVFAAAAAVALALGRSDAPLGASLDGRALAVGEWVSAAETASPKIRFSDGSVVALASGTRARLSTLDAKGAHVVLESGTADVHVIPGHGAHYLVSSGPFAVEVTGTQFDVGFRPSDELFTLNMREGKVLVSGCVLGKGRELLAGESLSASCRAGHFEISAAAKPGARNVEPEPAAAAAPLDAGRDASQLNGARTTPLGPRPAAAAEPSWQTLSHQGRFADAYAIIAQEGIESVASRATVAELSLLGDTARFAGKPADALTAYQALRARAPGSQAARQAAFSIARVHFDQRAAYADAARWFRTYLAEQPAGPLAREAEGRLMESLSRAGDRDGARRVAQGYLTKYPHGPHERVALQLLGE